MISLGITFQLNPLYRVSRQKEEKATETNLSSNLLQYYHLSMNHLNNYTHKRDLILSTECTPVNH